MKLTGVHSQAMPMQCGLGHQHIPVMQVSASRNVKRDYFADLLPIPLNKNRSRMFWVMLRGILCCSSIPPFLECFLFKNTLWLFKVSSPVLVFLALSPSHRTIG